MDLFFALSVIVLLVIASWSLWFGLKDEKISYGHIFQHRLWAEKAISPRLFWIVVAFHVFVIFGALLNFALGFE